MSTSFKSKRYVVNLAADPSKPIARVVEAIEPIRTVINFPKHAKLFEEGGAPGGIFILLEGSAKLFVTLKGGKPLILGIAHPGEILGLSAVVSGRAAEFTAETLTSARFSFVEQKEFLRLVERNREVCVSVVELLSHQLREAVEMIHYSGGSQAAVEKLAALLDSWIGQNGERADQEAELKLPLTQEEIGQMIGVSRETVSRLLAEFEREGILALEGSRLIVLKRRALAAYRKSSREAGRKIDAGHASGESGSDPGSVSDEQADNGYAAKAPSK